MPLITDDTGLPIFGLFHTDNLLPSAVYIDHTMTVRVKPWTLDSNTNTSSCDGTNNTIDGWSGGNTSDFIQQLVDECGTLCLGCTDCDEDGVEDTEDNCPGTSNSSQSDVDGGKTTLYSPIYDLSEF